MHWNVALASPESKAKFASVDWAYPDGPDVIEMVGGVVSITQEYDDAPLVFVPATAFAANVCEPAANDEYVFGDVQAVKAAPSNEH